MRKNIIVFVLCILICASAYRWGGTGLEDIKKTLAENVYAEVFRGFFPMIYFYDMSGYEVVLEDAERVLTPILASVVSVGQGDDKTKVDVGTTELEESGQEDDKVMVDTQEEENTEVWSSEAVSIAGLQKKVLINRTKLQDFDYLRQNFYQVDSSTTVSSQLLNVEELLSEDLTLTDNVDGPQVLIYHTHSQEGYVDSVEGDSTTSIIGVGNYLEKLLEEKYGIEVLHHTGVYDLPTRNSAYSQALPALKKILEENPTIEVVIDLHRDGVAETTHLVTKINGKQTAKIMFFNGLSYTTSQGALTYLENPYIEENLAFSFQMQLAAEEYYPGFARKIYLKGYRYNLHLCPKSILVEVGAQTNSLQEALNAMEPLADILALVLLDE